MRGVEERFWEEVDKIRDLYSVGGITMAKLGEIYSVSDCTICDIINFKSWIR